METIEIRMRNIYGLNKRNNELLIKSSKKHNFIYGVNAIGKTSFAKGLEHISKSTSYYKLIDTDHDDFSIDFNFDNLTEKLIKENNFSAISKEVNKRLFIFTKRYLEQNIALINGDDSNIQIGISIADRELYINQVDNIIENLQKDIFESIKEKGLKTTKEGFGETSNIIKLKATSKDKEKEKKDKKNAFNNLYQKNTDDFKIKISKLLINDFNGENLKLYIKISEILSDLILTAKFSLENKIKDELYKINNVGDKEFYEYVLNYLTMNINLDECPICKNNDFSNEKIIETITNSLRELLSEKIVEEINKHFIKININKNSYFYDLFSQIFNSILVRNIDVSMVRKFIEEIIDFNEKYDSYIIAFTEIKLDENIKIEYDRKNNLIDDINKRNSELIEEDKFIIQLDKMLEYIFGDNIFNAKRFEYNENGNKYYGVQLILNGVMKEGISITNFWKEILSESQKTKISLAFMFAVITYNNYNGKILCIFDDPIDSYDSINKYKMSRIIYNFIEKEDIFSNYNYDCYDIIFSHSIEYMRLFKNNFNYKKTDELLNYFVLTKNEISFIPFNKLYILDGDFSILNKIINESKKGVKFSMDKYIALLPIIRELASISRKVFDKGDEIKIKVADYNIKELDNYISKNVIHGFNENLKLNDLYSYIEKYIKIEVNDINDDKIFDYLKKHIDNNISNYEGMNLYEQIFFKNNISVYIRAILDNELSSAIKEDIVDFQNKSLEEINNEFRTMQDKISKLSEDDEISDKYSQLIFMCAQIKPMLNDFAHSANIFLTPLIDVEIKELNDLYDSLSACIEF